MDDLAIIDRFTETFSRYIDSGFGLLAGDVAFLTSVLVAIDITLAGLFWALMGEDNVVAQLIRKVLYVGFFALLLNNFKGLADIIFQSFAGLGLKASGASLTAADLMRPGFVASTGFTASRPLLEKAGELIGITSFFTNFVTIVVLMLAWLIVLLAFFVLSVQLFITIIEFKLTVLAGFVLVPFALFGQTAFLAERVLGNVISAGIKLMVLAIVVGIGATLFGTLIRPSRRDHADAGGLDHPGRHRRVRAWPCSCRALPPASCLARRSSAPARPSPPRRRSAARPWPAACWQPAALAWPAAPRAEPSRPPPRSPAGSVPRMRRADARGVARTTVTAPASRMIASGTGPVRDAYRQGAAQGYRDAQPPSDPGDPGRGADAMAGSEHNQTRRRGHKASRAASARPRPGWSRHKRCARATARQAAAAPISRTRAEGEQIMTFKRAGLRYGETPEPVTPYQKAAQVWDERIGSARVQAHNWRLMALGSLVLSIILAAILLWLGRSGSTTPYIVEVDPRGGARAVGPPQRPTSRATRRSPSISRASSTTCARCRSIRSSCARTGSRPTTS